MAETAAGYKAAARFTVTPNRYLESRMTDRKLLELAAKATGIKAYWNPYANGVQWNPLADDGDALRLAVELKIDVAQTNIHSPQVHALADGKVHVWEDIGADPYAATRRAIVRAAAEIGRSMSHNAEITGG